MSNAIQGPVRVDAATCRDYHRSSKLEWVEANGLGSFACGTVAGAQTRRYSGLFVAATRPPVERALLLSHFEETCSVAGDEPAALWCQAFGDGGARVEPRGFERIASFALDPWPTWTFDLGDGATLTREIAMIRDRQGIAIRWTLAGADGPGRLSLRPLFAWRDYHAILREDAGRQIAAASEAGDGHAWRFAAPNWKSYLPPADCALHLRSTAPLRYDADPLWRRDYFYAIEDIDRGDPDREDKHSPGVFHATLENGASLIFWAGLDADAAPEEIAGWLDAERARRAALTLPTRRDHPDASLLARAADQFVARRGSGLATAVAGYPWFTDWGRDTMISLPGLALGTGRIKDAEGMLLAFAEAGSEGMIPNRFPDEGEHPEYNTVDATLWFFEAARRFLDAGGDRAAFDAKLWPFFKSALEWHERGTRYGIRVDPADGLLRAGEAGTQLTWMDAKYGDDVFTPRHGKAVEICALWVNALRLAEEWAKERGEGALAEKCARMAATATSAFDAKFWNAERGCLYDVIESDGPNHRDGAIRPNQVFAISVPRTPLRRDRFAPALDVVEKALLTPYGLRSLAPGEPRYEGIYIGDRYTRDSQYHNGPVWGWLIGPYVSAAIRTRGDSESTRADLRAKIAPILAFMRGRGLGQIAEIYDGDAPHEPRACFAQAWSVAEIIRVVVEHGL